jgi:hypothetical protein
MSQKKLDALKYIFLFLLLQFYIIGFFLRENVAGGAEKDFLNYTWPLIEAFKDQFYNTLKNYRSFGEGSLPLFHITNAFINPFTFSKISFQGSITFISLLSVIFFSQIIRDKFKIRELDSIVYSSIFLILPFFRSSAYWGLTENFGWLFLILSIKYYLKEEKSEKKKTVKHIFFICLFSSLALYIRPYLIFFPIFIILNILKDRNTHFLKYTCLFYFLFSLPGFFLLYLWGFDFTVAGEKVGLIQDYHNPKFILKNTVIFSTIFLFYFLPWEFSSFLKKIEFPKKEKILIFLSILLLLSLLSFLNIFEYLNNIKLGGGAILKINQILFKNQNLFFIFISSIGFALIIDYMKISKKNLILFFSLLIFCFPIYILQEYFEPLVIILLFTLMELRKDSIKLIRDNKTIFIFCSYFVIYFIGSYYYRYLF